MLEKSCTIADVVAKENSGYIDTGLRKGDIIMNSEGQNIILYSSYSRMNIFHLSYDNFIAKAK